MSYVRPRGLGETAVAKPASASSAVRDLVDSDAVKTAAGAAMVYHGYRRTGSIVWALIYGLAGRQYPVVTTAIATAQGFGERKKCP